MKRSIKCQNCGTWNVLTGEKNQRCSNCGEVLKDEMQERLNKLSEIRKEQLDKWMFTIKEDDNAFTKFFKKTGNILYLIFISIIAFISWLLAILPA
ncbi:hypothetical protein JKA74_01510 [Marivirga sp. S37H4]|uniref:Uncharacterized protein n=1 Tax=Marivirga aurantiaca TaxID=2802615 RepID=A0A935C579_9BACT|nr:hypothetical protein [Marivirga aurantiaca]MBK6263696.1 hypothetical protein [Marivirga aurantiaca]